MKAAHTKTWVPLLIAVLGFIPGAVWAQSATPETTNGIKLGEGRLHPYLDLDLHYDSAAGFLPRNGGPATLQPELIGHLRPGLRLDLPSDYAAITFAGDLDYVDYTGLLTPGSQALSHLEGAADFNVDFNRKGQVGFALGDHLIRSDRTQNAALGVGVISLLNEVRALVPIRPGGGALELDPRASFTVEFFDPLSLLTAPGCADITCNPAAVRAMDYQNFQFGLTGRWKFLPKTAVVLDSGIDLRNYPGGGSSNPPAQLFKTTAGLAGLLTPRIAIVAKVGWGYDFAGSGANTLLAHAEANYLMSDVSGVKVGYLRELTPIPTYGTMGDDRGYIDGKLALGGKLNLHGYAAFDYLSFYSRSNRNDTLFTLDLRPEYQFTSWWIIAGGYTLSTHYSNSSQAQSSNFTRHELYLQVTFTY